MFKPSKNPQVVELTKSHRERSIHLGELLVVKLPELNAKGKPKRMCCWCTENELFSNAQRYCSEECRTSATAWAYPQKEDVLLFLMLRQNWKCFACSYDYKPLIDKIMAKDKYRHSTISDKLMWYHMKSLKNIVEPKHRPEVDHLIPVSKGGECLGLENHQVLCMECHKAKTKIDNSGPRKKLTL